MHDDGIRLCRDSLLEEEMQKPTKSIYFGSAIWTNDKLDQLRKTECLCVNCADSKTCKILLSLVNVCKENNIVVATTRCQSWRQKDG